ncbi:MAG: hypothetical protein OXU40_08780 [Nitrospira sp.]|nr:hypothetical protein [Nitrospira sp.]
MKVHAFLSWFMQFAGVGGFLFLMATRDASDPGIGPFLVFAIVLFLVGFVWQVVTKIVEWWHHKQR